MRRAIVLMVQLLAAGCRAAPPPPPEVVIAPPPATAPALPAPPPEPPRPSCPPRAPIGIVTIAPDRRAMVTTCSGDVEICGKADDHQLVDVWDVAAGGLARRLEMELPKVTYLSWGPGDLLTAVANPTTGPCDVRVWSTATWTLAASTPLYCFQSLAFDPAGEHVVLGGCDGEMLAIEPRTGKIVSRPNKEAHIGGDYGMEVHYTDDGRRVMVADEATGLQVLRAATLVREAEAGAHRLVCQAFAPQKDRAAVVDDTGTLQVFEAARPRRWRKLARDADHACTAIAWIDPARLAVARDDGTLTVWDVDRASVAYALRKAGSAVTRLAADGSGRMLASIDGESTAIWDLDRGTLRAAIKRPPAPDAGGGGIEYTIPSWSPTGRHLAVLADEQVALWEKRSGTLARLALGGDLRVARSLAWSEDGAVLAFTDGDAHLVRIADRAQLTLSVFVREGRRTGLVASRDGRFAGPEELAHCAGTADAPLKASGSLLDDLFVGR